MGRCRALYAEPSPWRVPRSGVELERDVVILTLPDAKRRNLRLNGCRFAIRDATSSQRFVRHLTLHLKSGRADLITPPDLGSIAPRAARLPGVPDDAVVLETDDFDAVSDWVRSGGRLGGRTVAELARIARIAGPQFATLIGEIAARVAVEMIWEQHGPMRGGTDMRHTLRPLQEAARHSPRAADALIAALAATSALRRRRR